LVEEWDLALVMVLVQERVSSLVKEWDLVLVMESVQEMV
jgi:hypothetical protein